MGEDITLPVSLGEVIDRLTILEIKHDKILEKRLELKKEIEAIYEKVGKYYDENVNFFRKMLKIINQEIWDIQDEFRREIKIHSKGLLADKIIELNDCRFRVKKKVENYVNSQIMEYKSYPKSKCLFLGHLGMGDHILTSPIIRYLSTRFDEVLLICKNKNLETLKEFYADDPSIKFYPIENDSEISPYYGYSKNLFNKKFSEYKVLLVGFHKFPFLNFYQKMFQNKNQFSYIPFNFYDDLNISRKTLIDYNHLHSKKESVDLYKVIENYNFMLIHSENSNGKIFDISDVEKRNNLSRDEVLMLDISRNVYPKGHKFFDVAEKFVNKPLNVYSETIKKSTRIYATDSALFCLAILQATNCEINYVGRKYENKEDSNNYQYITDFYRFHGYKPKLVIQKFIIN